MFKQNKKLKQALLIAGLLTTSAISTSVLAQDGFYADLTANSIVSEKITNQVNVQQAFALSADVYLRDLTTTRDILAIKGANKDKVLVTNHNGHILISLEQENTVLHTLDPVLKKGMWQSVSVSYDKKAFITLMVDGVDIELSIADYYMAENGIDASIAQTGPLVGSQEDKLVVGSSSYQGLIDNVRLYNDIDTASSPVLNWTFEGYNNKNLVSAVDGTSINGLTEDLEYDRQIVGTYVPYYKIGQISPEVAKKTTHMYYFSFGPNSFGELGRVKGNGDFTHIDDIDSVESDMAELNSWREGLNTKLVVVLGGWVQSDYLDEAAANPTARTNLVNNIRAFIDKYDLDGVDIDWEGYKGGVHSWNYSLLLKEFRANFAGTDLELSATINASPSKALAPHFEKYTDFVQLMTYGPTIRFTPERPNGTQYPLGAISWSVNKWQEYGLNKEKIVVGLPQFSRSAGNKIPRAVVYKDIIKMYDPATNVDNVDHLDTKQYFNGVETIKEKTNYNHKLGTGGVMFWEQGQDVDPSHPKSLLSAAAEIIGVNPNVDK